MVVDDNADAAEMLAAALTAKGYQTRVAHDGPAALLVAEAFRPAIGFLDLGLPVMDGYELAARLREIPDLTTHEAHRRHRIWARIGSSENASKRDFITISSNRSILRAVDEVLAQMAARRPASEERESLQ